MVCSLYIHIPFCRKKCDYCDFFSVVPGKTDSTLFSGYILSLEKEIYARRSSFRIEGWKTVYIGGGTPSLLSPHNILELGRIIRLDGVLRLDEGIEWTIEANPEDITAEWLEACAAAGISRLSLGIQTLNDDSLIALGRRGGRKSSIRALELVQRFWKGEVSLDFISGLPFQTEAVIESDFAAVFPFDPDHISLYSLTIESGTPLAKQGHQSLPDEDRSADLWLAGRKILENAGYRQYEVSNFAKPGRECRHNLTYWNMESYIGAGPGAAGTIITPEGAVRFENCKDIQKWSGNPAESFITETIDTHTAIIEFLLMGMRLAAGIDCGEFERRFKTGVFQYIGGTLSRWEAKKLLRLADGRIALTGEGLLYLNSFLTECIYEIEAYNKRYSQE
ncbi:radical SAM family heme chaperone HemW [Brucepastera parasyntrophica]|uniref:radical SAM family heme chaperone HemW n=1 Tax=Brucepastera parasyntrophica TaxID=2880008 RepID=UPI00210A1ED7|nr:radical SAM family heme chaperone HemW [Brucepastera parasyntrophica]ULQ59998.1 radical SAM family heme chaperone HemW [Brucepastera parasyntrophica]